MTESVVSPDLTQPLSLNEYLFCLNNPFAFLDADGRLFTEAENQASIINSRIKTYRSYPSTDHDIVSDFQSGKVKNLVCNQYVALAYKLGGKLNVPYSGTVNDLKTWFNSGKPSSRSYLTGDQITMDNLEKGDVLIMSWGGSKIPTHVEMIKEVFQTNGTVTGFRVEGAKSTSSGVGERKYFPVWTNIGQ